MPRQTETKSTNYVPVILAGASNLELWPLSRINHPIQFDIGLDGLSAFQRSMMLGADLAGGGTIWVSVASRCLDRARTQAEALDLKNTFEFMVEPVQRGNLAGLTAIALLLARKNRANHFVAIESHRPPTNNGVLKRFCTRALSSLPPPLPVILCADRKMQSRSETVVLPVSSDATELHLHRVEGDDANAGRTLAPCGVMISSVRGFLDMLAKASPNLIAECTASMGMAQTLNRAIWPDLNKWSLLESSELHDIAHCEETSVFIRELDLQVSVNPSPSTQSHQPLTEEERYLTNCHNCSVNGSGIVVAMDGCSDLDVTVSRDAVVIRNKLADAAEGSFGDQLFATENALAFDSPRVMNKWGVETTLERRQGFAVKLLHIAANQEIPAHLHSHRHESWQVLRGTAYMAIGDRAVRAGEGEIHTIPANTIHSVRALGDKPALLLETRRGRFLSDSDQIEIEPPQRPSCAG